MARKANARTVLNRQALTALQGSFADALANMGRAVIDTAKPPDATPFGVGLVTSGGWGVWAGTKKVDGTAAKPRSVRLDKGGVTMLVGWGFPGRFQELGTVRQPARPFATPAWLQVVPQPIGFFRAAFQKVNGRFR